MRGGVRERPTVCFEQVEQHRDRAGVARLTPDGRTAAHADEQHERWRRLPCVRVQRLAHLDSEGEAETAYGLGAVLVLRTRFVCLGGNAGSEVPEADGRTGLVPLLATGPGGAERVDGARRDERRVVHGKHSVAKRGLRHTETVAGRTSNVGGRDAILGVPLASADAGDGDVWSDR